MPTPDDARSSRRTRLVLVLVYAAVSIGWIVLSDAVVDALPEDVRQPLASAKGILFVLVTSALLWAVMLARDARVERAQAERLSELAARARIDEHHRQLAGAIDATPVGIATLARRGDRFEIAYVNPALARLTGAPVAHLVGRDPFDCEGLFGADASSELATRLLAGEAFETEATYRGRDGTAGRYGISVSPMAGPTGSEGSVVLIVLDRGEAVAREAAEARLGIVIDASPLPIVATDSRGRVTAWNPAASRLFGWPAAEVLGEPLPILPDGSLDALRSLADRVAAGEVPAIATLDLPRRDGRPVPCRLQASPINAEPGEGFGLVLAIEDLTTQIEQQHERAQLASAIDAAGEAVLVTALDGSITYVNPAFERVSGYSRAELLGRNPRILQSGKTSASVYADMWHQLRSGRVWRGVLFNRRKDGSLFEEEATLSPVFGADGEPIAYVGVKRDLTLERTLAAGLSTELNDRAAVQETMARLDQGEAPEETAHLLVTALAGFADVDHAVLEHLPPGEAPARVIAAAGDAAAACRPGDVQDAGRSATLRVRAAGEAWSSRQAGGVPPPSGVDVEGLTTVAAPVRHHGRAVAVLHLGARTPAPDAWVARYVRIASELAAHVGPVIGPELSRAETAHHNGGDGSAAREAAAGAAGPGSGDRPESAEPA